MLEDAKNKTNETPLHFAVSCNNYDIARILIDKIKEIIADRNGNGSTMNFTNMAEDLVDNYDSAEQLQYKQE